MLADVKYAARNLRRAPGFTTIVVLTLALGIGANTAIFSVVDALLFRPLPYPHATRLYAVTLANDAPLGMQYWPYPKYAAMARQQTVFDATAAYGRHELTIRIDDRPSRAEMEAVSSSYFPMLDVRPALGRVFTADEERAPARDAVAVLGDSLWRTAFGADPKAVGRTLDIKGRRYTVVGVLPPSFRGQSGNVQLWLPVMMADHFMFEGAASESSAWWMRVVARLKPDITRPAADAQMPALTGRVAADAPSIMKSATRGGRELFQLVPFKAIKVDPEVSRSFVLLLAAVGFVLLIACANTTNLLLGRAVSRQTEFAVRRALGASQGAIVRQVLVESLLLAALAGVAALLVSWWSLGWLSAAKPLNATGFWSQYSRTFDYFPVALDLRMAAFNCAVALGVGVLFGLLPARQSTHVDLNDSLKRRGEAPGAPGRFDARAVLVLAEITFSIVLLVSAGLMLRSFALAASATLGLNPSGVVTMTMSSDERKPIAFYRDILDRVSAIPGVQQATLANALPLTGSANGTSIEIEGRPAADGPLRGSINVVTPGFFATLGVRQAAGRLFTAEDDVAAPRVAIVNRTFARTAWPGGDAIGEHVRTGFRIGYGDPKAWTTIVGVVDDVVYSTLEEPVKPMLYLPGWQPLGTPAAVSLAPTWIALKSMLPPDILAAAVRGQIQPLDPNAPLHEVATMPDRAAAVTSRYRYSGTMMGALAALALVLAATGTYGVIAYSVARRTREIGIRVALGAGPRDVLGLVLGGAAKLTAGGLALGLASAFAASRLLTSLLYGVRPHDPVTFLAITAVIIAVALLASYLPARRAMRVDPVVALRNL